MALDLFQTSDIQHFWSVLGTTALATYVVAGIGLVAIYRKALLDVFGPFIWIIADPVHAVCNPLPWNIMAMLSKAYLTGKLNRSEDASVASSHTNSTTTGEDLAAQAMSQQESLGTSQVEPTSYPLPPTGSESAESVATQPSRTRSLPTIRRANTTGTSAFTDDSIRTNSAQTI